MKPRVIFATTVFDDVQTGPGIYARYLWRAFREDRDIEYHVVVPSSQERHPRIHLAEKSGGNIYARVGRRARELAAGRERETIVHGNAAHAMGEFLDYPGIWLAQVNDYEAAEVWRRPVQVVRSRNLRRLISMAWRHRQEGRVVRRATRIVCNSEFTRRKVMEIYRGASPDRLVTIYKAVDTSTFRRPANLPPDPLPDRPRGARLVYVGADWPRKGLLDLIEAVAIVARECPAVHLTVGGPAENDSLDTVRKAIARAGVERHVLLGGRISRNDLSAINFHSDLFTLLTREEALGVAILEAMASGLPVVSCPVGGVPEIIRSSEEGELVPPRDPHRAAEAILALLRDGERRKRLAEAGIRRAADFSTDTMIARVKDLYVRLAESDRNG